MVKHKSGWCYAFADALSRREHVLIGISGTVVGFELMLALYNENVMPQDPNFPNLNV